MASVKQTENVAEEIAHKLEEEARAWGHPVPAVLESSATLPVLDFGPYLAGEDGALPALAEQLRSACENEGFYFLKNHGVSPAQREDIFALNRTFHALPAEEKDKYPMNENGVGYMRVGERKLPKRDKGNLNEAFLVKREHGPRDVTLDKNVWPPIPEQFRTRVEQYTNAVEDLAMKMLRVYAVALDLDEDFFMDGFKDPLYRFRMSHYPQVTHPTEGDYGINPHVDTSFFTILAQGSPGLVVNIRDEQWAHVPCIEDTFVVNTGELLKQWSNNRFRSTRHYVPPATEQERYSVIFFFSPTADYRMECIPTCCSDGNPPQYPTLSYLEGQGVAQGE
eukprot:GFYU01003605.1.p1 GENE.GFYU01003605.1~~GFYU01003605.1.p1  ORF type:complete len:336 (-),score=65.64 GFYU01003605.1:799-1806(-)